MDDARRLDFSASEPAFESPCACPHVDRNDPRCARMFSLGQIDRFFSLCMDGYRRCAMYHLLTLEERVGRGRTLPAVAAASLAVGYLEVRVDDDAIRSAAARRLHAAAS